MSLAACSSFFQHLGACASAGLARKLYSSFQPGRTRTMMLLLRSAGFTRVRMTCRCMHMHHHIRMSCRCMHMHHRIRMSCRCICIITAPMAITTIATTNVVILPHNDDHHHHHHHHHHDEALVHVQQEHHLLLCGLPKCARGTGECAMHT